MLYKAFIGAEMSGKMGGIVASHNRGGQYFRVAVIPTDPGTVFQTAVRALFSLLASRWVETLTQLQRDAWDVYAVNVLLPNRLGSPINIGGLAHFQRTNVPRLQTEEADLGQIDDAPIIFDLGAGTLPTVGVISAAVNTVSIGFTNTDAWANAVGGGLLIKASRPQNQAVNFFKGPYQVAAPVLGAVAPPASPVITLLPFPVGVDNEVFFEFRFTQEDGRLSSQLRASGIVTA